jgi:hypothetical protein
MSMGGMSVPPRALLVALLLAAGAPACRTPGPRVPFDTGRGWMALATGGASWTDDRYIHGYTPFGVEFVTLTPGTAGWGWEVSGRFGQDTGEDSERKRVKGTTPGGANLTADVNVETERESKLYEFYAGVRQVFGPDWRVQPYFGVGAALQRILSEDDLQGTYAIVNPDNANDFFVYTPLDEDSRDWSFGLYARTGLAWRITGDPDGERLSLFFTTDVRGLVAHEFDTIEVNFGLGIGR